MIQHKQQRQRVEGLLQKGLELELMQEEMENMAQREDVRQRRTEQYEQRMREEEEKEGKEEEVADDVLEDLVVPGSVVSSVGSSKIMETSYPVKPKNPRGKKSRMEETIAEEVEEDEEEEKLEEVTRKRKIGGCINLQEAVAFQKFVNDKMMELVERMCNDKNFVQPVQKLICSVKLSLTTMEWLMWRKYSKLSIT